MRASRVGRRIRVFLAVLTGLQTLSPFTRAEVFYFDDDPLPVENFEKFKHKKLKEVYNLVLNKANRFCEKQVCFDRVSNSKKGCNLAKNLWLAVDPEEGGDVPAMSKDGLQGVADLYYVAIECQYVRGAQYFLPAVSSDAILAEFSGFLGAAPLNEPVCPHAVPVVMSFEPVVALSERVSPVLSRVDPPTPPSLLASPRASVQASPRAADSGVNAGDTPVLRRKREEKVPEVKNQLRPRGMPRGTQKKPYIPLLRPERFRVHRPPVFQPLADHVSNISSNTSLVTSRLGIQEERDHHPMWATVVDLVSDIQPRADLAQVSDYLERGADGNVYIHYQNDTVNRRVQVSPAEFLWVVTMRKEFGLTPSGVPFNNNPELQTELLQDFLTLFPEVVRRKMEDIKREDTVWEDSEADLKKHAPNTRAKTEFLGYRDGHLHFYTEEFGNCEFSPRELYFVLARELEFGQDRLGKVLFFGPEIHEKLREDFAKIYPRSNFSKALQELKRINRE